MRTVPTTSALACLALVGAVLAATPASADDGAPAGPVVRSVPSVPRAVGLIVTGRASAVTVRRAADAELAGDVEVDEVASSVGSRVVRFDQVVSAAVAQDAARELARRPDVESAVPDYVRTSADAPPVSVNDPLFPQQGWLWDTTRPAGGYSTRAPAFWTVTKGVPSVRVAVLDTGRTSHPDIAWAQGRDMVQGDDDPTDPDSLLTSNGFHGTHVAGIVGATADNRTGVSGVAPGSTIVPVRVLGSDGNGFDSDVVAGIYWAAGFTVAGSTIAAPARVITMSLAGPGPCTSAYVNAIAAARSRGVVVVAAAGNNGEDVAGFAPANCPGVITVGATDAAGARASFSNTGTGVDISAPGVNILSTYRDVNQPAYARVSGTSMAAPAVAGAAALLASTGMSGAQIESVLPTMVTPSTTPGTAGILNLTPAAPPARARVATRVSLKVSSSRVRSGGRVSLRVALTSVAGPRPSGRIRVYDGSRRLRSVTVSTPRRGRITIRTPRLRRSGAHRLRVVYTGSGTFEPSRSATRRIRVL